MTYKSFLLLFCFVFFIGGQACDKNTCDYQTKVLSEDVSPDGKLKAVIFDVSVVESRESTGNCPGGANNYQSLSILPATEKIPEGVKKGTPDKGNTIGINRNLRARWVSNNEILVTGAQNDSPDRPKTVNGVTVRYEMDAQPGNK